MKREIPAGYTMVGGILLALVILMMIVTQPNLINLSKNTIFRTQKIREIFRLSGILARTDDGGFLNYYDNLIRRVDDSGRIVWQKDLAQKELLWMGSKGFITVGGGALTMWSAAGEQVFQKDIFIENPEILCMEGDYILFSGKLQGKPYAALMNTRGALIWQIPIAGRAISGRTSTSGSYTVLNVLEEDLSSKLVFINSAGHLLWEIKQPVMTLCMEFVPGGVEAVAEDRVFKVDFQGSVVSKHVFENTVLRADVGKDGYIAAVVNQKQTKLASEQQANVIMLDPECCIKWSYAVDIPPVNIKKAGEFVHIIYGDKILALSREGILAYDLYCANAKGIEPVDDSRIIIKRDEDSSLMEIYGGSDL
ncbi:MAG: hypothetical protein PWQ97_489 [Tepidanaerobacteraceae bacterium]|nr:hypothetical protein [Tepidanaerobacteraceae bacterium]